MNWRRCYACPDAARCAWRLSSGLMKQSSALWRVQVQGWAFDLEYLALHLTSEPCRVLKDERDDCFFYESDSFAACQTPDEVLKLANDELCILSGALRTMRDSPGALLTGAVYRRNSAGGRDVFDFIQETARVGAELIEGTVTNMDAGGKVITKPAPVSRTVTLVKLAAVDLAAAKVMRLFTSPEYRTRVGMYRIYEVIEADVGGESAFKRRAWRSTTDLRRFKHSANSISVAGDSARHGKEVGQPPRHPMSVDEAAAYLNDVLQLWLSSKGV